MTHGFNTRKTPEGFSWAITQTEWDDTAKCARSRVVKEGQSPTRAKATGAAKRWVLFFRRGGTVA